MKFEGFSHPEWFKDNGLPIIYACACGNDDQDAFTIVGHNGFFNECHVMCDICKITGVVRPTPQDAILSWNTAMVHVQVERILDGN